MDFNALNKVAGAFLGALLVLLLVDFFSQKAIDSGGHHDDVLAFALEIEEEGGEVEAEPAIDLAALVAAADPSAGGGIFRQCGACHKVEDGANGVGPHLYGVVGRAIGSVDGFAYSDALAGHGGEWNVETLSGFLENPKGWAPGTKMAYAGLKDAEDRVNLIAWLNEEGGSNVDLAAGLTPVETTEAPAETATDAAEEAPAETEAAPEEATATEEEAAVEPAATEEATAEATTEATEEATTEEATAEAPAEATEEAPAETAAAEESAPAEAEETVEVAAAPAAEEAPAADSLYASVSAEDGRKIFRQCSACHVAEEGKNRVGPHLWGVVGRGVGSVEGYKYSDAMTGFGGDWSPERLSSYLEDPRGVVDGTKMVFRGLKDESDRAAVIKWLNEQSDAPVALP
ncbi:MAG: c-type cytochrome [Pseudomonadota bacterium]